MLKNREAIFHLWNFCETPAGNTRCEYQHVHRGCWALEELLSSMKELPNWWYNTKKESKRHLVVYHSTFGRSSQVHIVQERSVRGPEKGNQKVEFMILLFYVLMDCTHSVNLEAYNYSKSKWNRYVSQGGALREIHQYRHNLATCPTRVRQSE